jgi:hypothetical protein
MAFDPKDKEKVLEFLMTVHRQGQFMEVKLRLQGKPDEAEKLWQSNTRLSTEIDILIGQIMDEWLGDAERAIEDLTDAKAKLGAAVADIKQQIDVPQNVVKVLGLLDEAVAIAKKAVAGF